MALHRNFWDTQPFQGELGADEPRKKKLTFREILVV